VAYGTDEAFAQDRDDDGVRFETTGQLSSGTEDRSRADIHLHEFLNERGTSIGLLLDPKQARQFVGRDQNNEVMFTLTLKAVPGLAAHRPGKQPLERLDFVGRAAPLGDTLLGRLNEQEAFDAHVAPLDFEVESHDGKSFLRYLPKDEAQERLVKSGQMALGASHNKYMWVLELSPEAVDSLLQR